MTASSPRPTGSACPVGRVVYGDRPCEGPGTYYCDGDLWRSACHRYYEAKREASAAPDTTGGELRDDGWWTRLFLASSEAVDSVPYAAGPEYPVPHAAAFRSAVEPALRDLLAERDKLAAQVQAVEGLAEELRDESRDRSFSWDALATLDDVADRIRRALGTP